MLNCPQSVAELDELITRPSEELLHLLEKMSGRYSVLGAGGKMGFHTSLKLQRALKLLGREHPVTVVSRFRSEQQRKLFDDRGFKVVPCDLSEAAGVASLPDADYIVFLAGVKFGTHENLQLLQRMNISMPELIAERYRDSAIVALSTGCVYSFTTPDTGGSKETSPTNPPGAYAQSCLGRERAFIKAAEAFGTRSSLIRLNYANDLRYGVLVDIAQRVLTNQPVSLETGYVNVIWQGDAIEYALKSFGKASAPPFILNVTGTECLQVRDIATKMGIMCGRTVTFSGVEAPEAWLNDASQSYALFGRPVVDTDTLINWTITWLQQGGETLNKPTHFEVRDGAY
jgi:nucleoside-diphosphate-sugar epimerase